MQKFDVTGMSCASCVSHVEKSVQRLDGVKNVSVSLLTNSMAVDFDKPCSSDKIIEAVKNAGYGASLSDGSEGLKKGGGEIKKLKTRLFVSLCFLIPLMYVSMGHMLGLTLPPFLSGTQNAVWFGLTQFALTLPVCIINGKFFVSGVKGVINRSLGMDTLVCLGAGAAMLYGIFAIVQIIIGNVTNNEHLVMHYMHDLYFESAAMILTLITLGKLLEAYSKGRTTSAIKSLMDLTPPEAVLLIDSNEVTVPIARVKKDDVFIVKAGEKFPVDGVIIKGTSSVDNSAFTGESMPEDVTVGDSVNAAAINRQGVLVCKATRVGTDTTLSQVIKLVSEASATKAPLAKSVDKVSAVFVPVVIALSLITFAVWMIFNGEFSFSLARAISVLVISCPCALGLATPVAIMVGNGVGAKNGVLFKTAASLEYTGKVQTVVLDKTGTITKGTPYVVEILPCDGLNENELIKTAASVESQSEHPLAKAISDYVKEKNISFKKANDVSEMTGKGLKGTFDGKTVIGASLKYMKTVVEVSPLFEEKCEKLSQKGITPLLFGFDGKLVGVIGVADVIKETSKDAISQLKRQGINVYMLTGDNRNTSLNIGAQVGLDADSIYSDVMPSDKETVVSKLQKQSLTAMVGDGINDAPALTRADVGIAIGSGTDIAIDAADVVLVRNDLRDVACSVRLSRRVINNIHQNLFWAFMYNTVCIPIAAGILYPIWGIVLNPMIAAAAMSLSSVSVVLNALRLNYVKIRDPKHDRPYKFKNTKAKETKNTMIKTITIEGMMCEHCESRVKKALESIVGVTAKVDHSDGKAYVECIETVDNETLKNAVEEQGYKVLDIE